MNSSIPQAEGIRKHTSDLTIHLANPETTSPARRGELTARGYGAYFAEPGTKPANLLLALLTDLHHYAATEGLALGALCDTAGEAYTERVAASCGQPDGPRVIATVQPQEWIRDQAVDAGPSFDIDITPIIEAMSAEQRGQIEDNDHSSDHLYEQAVVRGLAPRHTGPFYVEVVDSLRTWEAVSCDDCHEKGRKVAVDELDGEGGDIGDIDRLAEARVLEGDARCDRHDI